MKGWNWDGFFEYLTNTYILEGAAVTLGLTIAAMTLGVVAGCIVALMRMSLFR